METKETLVKALAEMKQRGRTRKTLLNSDGECCALGAVGLALEIEENRLKVGHYEAYERLKASPAVKSLGDQLPDTPEDVEAGYQEAAHRKVYNFNDHVLTTDWDVYDLFERAIAAAS